MADNIQVLRAEAEQARIQGQIERLLTATHRLLEMGDEGDPPGVNASRIGAILIAREKWLDGIALLQRAYGAVQPGSSLHATVLHNLALAFVELEAPNDVLTIVQEYTDHYATFPPQAQEFLGRMLQHKAAALEIVDPAQAPSAYAEAARMSVGEIRQLALVDQAWAELQIGRVEAAAEVYATVETTALAERGQFAYFSVGAHLLFRQGYFEEAENLRQRALEAIERVGPQTVRRAQLVLLGAEIALEMGNIEAGELAGNEAAAIFRSERRQQLYARAQDFLVRVVRKRLA